ncbi:hypothetical protein HK104_003039, partial [Borealophlyctis nickersoniae]
MPPSIHTELPVTPPPQSAQQQYPFLTNDPNYDYFIHKPGAASSAPSSIRRTLSRMGSSLHKRDYCFFGVTKVVVLGANAVFTFIGLALLLFFIFTYTHIYTTSPLIPTTHPLTLPSITSLSIIMIVTGVLGLLGTLMHKRGVVACYVVMIVPALVVDVWIGYTSFKFVGDVHFDTVVP